MVRHTVIDNTLPYNCSLFLPVKCRSIIFIIYNYFSYKNDELGDPLINSYFAVALGLADWDEIEKIKKYAFKVNEVLKAYFLQADIKLVDFKIEFGR